MGGRCGSAWSRCRSADRRAGFGLVPYVSGLSVARAAQTLARLAMNYRHQFHAGNFADVMKHVLLIRLFRAMQKKERGFLFLDTHAGRGRYDLTFAATGD